MAILYLLGTGAALSDPHRTTTMLAFVEETSTLLVDCGGDAGQRLLAAGLGLSTLSALMLTHEHPDHVSGFPLLVEKLWLAGRRDPLPVYGLAPALEQARRCFDTFDTSRWEGLPERRWHPIPHEEDALVLEDATWRVTASPGIHSVPVVGLRVESRQTGGVVAYSCDTEPTATIACLAHQSDLLVHEATGPYPGHSSAAQAAQVAVQAEARRLLLVHVPAGLTDENLAEARQVFPRTEVGEELGAYGF